MPNEANNSFVQLSSVPKISVFGVGGAGVNAVNHMILSQLDGVKFVAANTDCQSLNNSLAEIKIQLGAKCTKGLGAGSNPELGRQAGEEASDLIKRELTETDMLFIATGMGGGTGTGASPIIAKIAKDMGILVVGIAIKPFKLEGKKRMDVANNGIQELEQYVDTLIVIENEKLLKMNNVSMIENYAIADGILRQAVYCVVSILDKQGFMNRDFADVKTILSNAGRAIIGYGEDIDPKVATDMAIHNQVLEDTSINGAKNILLNITGNKDLKTSDVEDVVEKVRNEATSFNNEEPNVIFGIAFDENLGNNVRVSVIASGVEKIQSNQADLTDAQIVQIGQNKQTERQKIAIKSGEENTEIEQEIIQNPVFAEPILEDDLENEDEFNLRTDEIPINKEKIINFTSELRQISEKKKIANNGNFSEKMPKKARNFDVIEQSEGLFSNITEPQKKGIFSRIIKTISPIPLAEEMSEEDDDISFERKKASNE